MTHRRASQTYAAVLALVVSAGGAFAQGFPAPLPGQAPAAAGASPFPPVNGAAPSSSATAPSPFPSAGVAPISGAPQSASPPGPSAGGGGGGANDCEKGFLPLRADAEKRGQAIKAASDRKATPDEACKLIGAFSIAEVKMIKFVETNAQKCGIPAQVSDQMKAGHKNTDTMMKKVCGIAQQQQQRGPAGPSLSEVLGSSSALPEATTTRRGGSTFDTLNGNVLTR